MTSYTRTLAHSAVVCPNDFVVDGKDGRTFRMSYNDLRKLDDASTPRDMSSWLPSEMHRCELDVQDDDLRHPTPTGFPKLLSFRQLSTLTYSGSQRHFSYISIRSLPNINLRLQSKQLRKTSPGSLVLSLVSLGSYMSVALWLW